MMHQDTFLDAVIDEYLGWHYDLNETNTGELFPILKKIAIRVIKPAVEYSDDGTDPLEYTEFGSSESELDYIFDNVECSFTGEFL